MMRLSDVAEIDLPAAFVDKMAKNRDKYPAEQVYSSSAKYTEYRAKARGEAAERRDGRREAAERRAEEHRRSRRRSRGKMRGRSGRSRPRRVRAKARVGRANQRGRSLRACRRESRAADREEAASVAASESTTPAAASDGAPARGVWWRSTRRRGRVASVSAPGPKQASTRMGSRATPPTTTGQPCSKHVILPRLVPSVR